MKNKLLIIALLLFSVNVQAATYGCVDTTLIVPNIPSDTVVYFAVVLCDEVRNCSGLSNVYEMQTTDMTAPAPVSDLRE